MSLNFRYLARGVLRNERVGARGPGAHGGGGAGARERDGRAAARQDRGEDV